MSVSDGRQGLYQRYQSSHDLAIAGAGSPGIDAITGIAPKSLDYPRNLWGYLEQGAPTKGDGRSVRAGGDECAAAQGVHQRQGVAAGGCGLRLLPGAIVGDGDIEGADA